MSVGQTSLSEVRAIERRLGASPALFNRGARERLSPIEALMAASAGVIRCMCLISFVVLLPARPTGPVYVLDLNGVNAPLNRILLNTGVPNDLGSQLGWLGLRVNLRARRELVLRMNEPICRTYII